MRRRRFEPARWAAAALLALLFVPGGADARAISEKITLNEGGYYYIEIRGGVAGNGSDLAVHWEADRPVDVWIISGPQFQNYRDNKAFASEFEFNGTAGALVFNVSAARSNEEPFYFIIDHTARGVVRPPSSDPKVVQVSLGGQTRMAGYSSGWESSSPAFDAMMETALWAALLLPIVVLASFFVWRRRRLRRARAPPVAPPAAASPVNFCGFCGKPLVPGNAFCTQCGRPV